MAAVPPETLNAARVEPVMAPVPSATDPETAFRFTPCVVLFVDEVLDNVTVAAPVVRSRAAPPVVAIDASLIVTAVKALPTMPLPAEAPTAKPRTVLFAPRVIVS